MRVRWLGSWCPNLEKANNAGWTPIYSAVQNGHDPGKTPLWIGGHEATVRVLFGRGTRAMASRPTRTRRGTEVGRGETQPTSRRVCRRSR